LTTPKEMIVRVFHDYSRAALQSVGGADECRLVSAEPSSPAILKRNDAAHHLSLRGYLELVLVAQ
jgi:hypothetical protein